jgi:hypothetical protein
MEVAELPVSSKKMKSSLILIPAIAVYLLLCGCDSRAQADSNPPRSAPHTPIVQYARAVLQAGGLDYQESDLIALNEAAAILRKIIESEDSPDITAVLYADTEAVEVPWETILAEIRSGNAISAGQTHSLSVGIATRDGRRLKSTEPRIDAILDACKEVDPKMVFISYMTE